MPTKCCVFGCKNIDTSKSRQDLKISFHKVPKLEPERSKWLKVIPRKNGHFVLTTTETLSVCSGHFSLSDFDPDAKLLRRRLKSGMKPSIFEAYEKFALENNSFSKNFDPDPKLSRRRLKYRVESSIFEAFEEKEMLENNFSSDEKNPNDTEMNKKYCDNENLEIKEEFNNDEVALCDPVKQNTSEQLKNNLDEMDFCQDNFAEKNPSKISQAQKIHKNGKPYKEATSFSAEALKIFDMSFVKSCDNENFNENLEIKEEFNNDEIALCNPVKQNNSEQFKNNLDEFITKDVHEKYKCEKCDKSFKYFQNFTKHDRNVHGGRSDYEYAKIVQNEFETAYKKQSKKSDDKTEMINFVKVEIKEEVVDKDEIKSAYKKHSKRTSCSDNLNLNTEIDKKQSKNSDDKTEMINFVKVEIKEEVVDKDENICEYQEPICQIAIKDEFKNCNSELENDFCQDNFVDKNPSIISQAQKIHKNEKKTL